MNELRRSVILDTSNDTIVVLAIRLFCLGLLGYWTLILIKPFLTIMIWSAIIAVALYPIFDWLARRLRGYGPETVIVTLGAEGALACGDEAVLLHQRAFVIEVIDTLGAGDAFSAGLAVSLAEGRPFAECLQRAAACGALATRRLGVLQALPDRSELEQFLGNLAAVS